MISVHRREVIASIAAAAPIPFELEDAVRLSLSQADWLIILVCTGYAIGFSAIIYLIAYRLSAHRFY